MTFSSFTDSLENPAPPPDIHVLLEALWHDAKGNWEMAHDIAQEEDTAEGAWVHAYLHRKEGDNGNAGYWYQRAGKPVPSATLEQEWQQICRSLLQGR